MVRLSVRAESITATLVYTYNTNGLRVAQSVDSDVTTFAWDWASGLPEMVSEGANLYLVGHDTLGRWDGDEWAYHLPDALGSVRQVVDGAGMVTSAREWTPYGVEVGAAQAGLGYTGEWWDADAALLYLRARWYEPGVGRFTQKDPWMGYEQIPGTYNGFNYAMGNPINLNDPSGLQPWSGIMLMALCFDLHSGGYGIGGYGPGSSGSGAAMAFSHGQHPVTAKEAVEMCRASYNKENWNKDIYGFGLGQDLPKTAHELFGWYVHEWRGKYKSDRLFFDGNEPLTKELAKTNLVGILRVRYYRGREDLGGPSHYDFMFPEFVLTALDISSFRSLPISFVMGSFWYQIKAVGSDRVGFRIDNDITLESGSHIRGRFREDKFIDNVEDLIPIA